MSRSRFLVLAVSTLAVLGVVAPASAGASPYCGITWGSQPESADRGDREVVFDVRSGRHDCFDRLVVDVGGEDATFGSYSVRYVPVVRQDGSGDAVPVRGAADLEIVVRAPAYDEQGRPTFLPADPREVVDVAGYRTFRQVAYAGSFEGSTTLALGVRARLPFRVFTLDGTPNSDHTPRLVIDVAHRW
ncbi:AMIN-like domain-containing (lipo)protein [Geodermatophilus sp. SYSU D01176]